MTTIARTHWLSDEEASTMLRQIGRMNVLAVSGGRWHRADEDTLILPVHYGYDVRVRLDRGSDTYVVTRTFRRGFKVWIKATWSNVYCDEVGETVYRASCYHDEPVGAD